MYAGAAICLILNIFLCLSKISASVFTTYVKEDQNLSHSWTKRLLDSVLRLVVS